MVLSRKYRGIFEQMKGTTNLRSCEVTSVSFRRLQRAEFKIVAIVYLNVIFNGLKISHGAHAREKKRGRGIFATNI